jgi:CHAT domain-containing protein
MVRHEIVNLPSASVLAVLRQEAMGRKLAPRAVAVLADPVFDREDVRVKNPAANQDRVQTVQLTRGTGDDEKGAGEGETDEEIEAEPLTRSVPDMNATAGGAVYLPRLQLTRREARNILDATPPGEGMQALDFKASRATMMSPALAQYRIVHLATHGLVNSKHPELSGLVLSLVDEQGRRQNGFLGLEDIYNLNLPAELVVLSACETGLGQTVQGEGLIGLTRGFMYAGATRVVASLWKIDDLATAELMARFYRDMEQQKMRPAAALRAAQISMWKQKRWRSPYYWAAFQVHGEWK